MDPVIIQTYPNPNICLLTINRPQSLNAINHEVMAGLGSFFEENKDNKELHGVIITGAGEKAFVAGADIKKFLDFDDEQGKATSKFGHDVFNSIERFHVPVIAAVNGFALGGGCELAMACHMRIAATHARFGQPEVNLGLIPGYGGTQRLIQLIGKGKAIELMLTAQMIDANEAHRLGLVNHVVPAGEEVSKALEILTIIASKGPKAVSTIISLVNDYFDNEKGFINEYSEFGKLMQDGEVKIGVEAFLNKSTPNFRN